MSKRNQASIASFFKPRTGDETSFKENKKSIDADPNVAANKPSPVHQNKRKMDKQEDPNDELQLTFDEAEKAPKDHQRKRLKKKVVIDDDDLNLDDMEEVAKPEEKPKAVAKPSPKKSPKKTQVEDIEDDEQETNEDIVLLNNKTLMKASDEMKTTQKASPKKEAKPERTEPEVKEEKDTKPVHDFFAPRKQSNEKKPAVKSPVKREDDISEEDSVVVETRPKSPAKAVTSKSTKDAGTTKYTSGAYDPVADAGWKAGDKVPYLALAQTFAKIEEISARLKITELLTNLFRSIIVLSPQDLLPAVYLCINRIAPEYEGIELGVGESLIMKAIAEATGRTAQSLKAAYDEMGDLGIVAKTSRSNQRTLFAVAALTLQGVYKKLKDIALMQGVSSQAKKTDLIKSLLVACKESEAQYIVRSLQGKLRIGLAEKTVIAALAHAVVLTTENYRGGPIGSSLEAKMNKANEVIRSVYAEVPNYDVIIPILLKDGIEELPKKCFLTPGIPVHPMLAQPTKGISEVLDRFQGMTFTSEFKYDGERAQIHYQNGKINIYSRNLEDHTGKYPDIIQNLPKALGPEVTSFILDSEAVAYDKVTNKILPFQVLSHRGRKEVKLEDIKVQVCVFAFDLLFLNGKSLTKEPLIKRREILHSNFKQVDCEFTFAKYKDLSETEDIQTFLNEAVEGNCEGLMIKTLEQDATYEPSKRSYNWLKVKKDYLEGMGDSLDLVVIGAYIGRGKRTGVYGGFLLACYDDDSESFQSVCKIGTGFSDDDLVKHTEFFKQHIISAPKKYYSYGDNVACDVWFEPVQVWEVLAADLSLSPVHKAAIGLVDPLKGIALRFPRFIRIREDKKPEEATTGTQVADMYNNQKINKASDVKDGEDD